MYLGAGASDRDLSVSIEGRSAFRLRRGAASVGSAAGVCAQRVCNHGCRRQGVCIAICDAQSAVAASMRAVGLAAEHGSRQLLIAHLTEATREESKLSGETGHGDWFVTGMALPKVGLRTRGVKRVPTGFGPWGETLGCGRRAAVLVPAGVQAHRVRRLARTPGGSGEARLSRSRPREQTQGP